MALLEPRAPGAEHTPSDPCTLTATALPSGLTLLWLFFNILVHVTTFKQQPTPYKFYYKSGCSLNYPPLLKQQQNCKK